VATRCAEAHRPCPIANQRSIERSWRGTRSPRSHEHAAARSAVATVAKREAAIACGCSTTSNTACSATVVATARANAPRKGTRARGCMWMGASTTTGFTGSGAKGLSHYPAWTRRDRQRVFAIQLVWSRMIFQPCGPLRQTSEKMPSSFFAAPWAARSR